MVDMLHYSWSTEKLLDESFYFFCSFWSKSFVSFLVEALNMAISMSNFVSKICYYSESSKCDTQYPFGYGYIMQKEMKWAIACGWRETFSGSHIYLFCAANSFCAFSYWNEDHQNCIKSFFHFVKRLSVHHICI